MAKKAVKRPTTRLPAIKPVSKVWLATVALVKAQILPMRQAITR